jgi:tRNA(adenine34) deaminase
VDDEALMRRAISVARHNPGGPFGAVVVHGSGSIIGEGTDRSDEDPTMHDVTAAIRASLATAGSSVAEASVYTTAEPCPMCASAIVWSGITRVVFGTSAQTLERMGQLGIQIGVAEVIGRSHRAGAIEIVGGVLESECDSLYIRGSDG